MKILVPTDFSDNANNALEFAKNIAKKEKASITLLYAFYAVYDFAAQATEILGQIEQEAKRTLKKAAEAGKNEGLEIDYRLLQGTVASVATSFAYREDYDLIVMGTQGASGIKKALVGSNTGHVIKESKIPVLAVPQKAKWENVKKISVGLELQKEEEKFFNHLFKVTKATKFPYEFFHVKTEDNFEKEIEFKGLESFLKEKHPELDIKFKTLSNKDVSTGFQNYLKENEDAMLVMFYKSKSFFEYLFNRSETLEMAYHTHVPLLVIK
ncbi:universal stress protein [Cecembia calidifontis]|jgi:nucleotide-binding universal stress UspA family protein|uniref:Nucleotide-binding universal stress UspA family protein n=1 Tax=Cecembia calidifontis TaxID=1187080 RepID=A0A4Q7PAR0_9BACT|nr:universal stress protein [Cecembia calidifontis]RZS97301.1 nucleotide-binding universal stress UspA family protein [Cecembia calidifontis]